MENGVVGATNHSSSETLLVTKFNVVGSSKSDISFVDCHTGQKVVLKIKGNFFDTKYRT